MPPGRGLLVGANSNNPRRSTRIASNATNSEIAELSPKKTILLALSRPRLITSAGLATLPMFLKADSAVAPAPIILTRIAIELFLPTTIATLEEDVALTKAKTPL